MPQAALLWALLALLSGCQASHESGASAGPDAATLPCGKDGFLNTELFGALQGPLQWSAADLECEGMPRPHGDGARLRFAGKAGEMQALAFIIALPDLRRGSTGREMRTTVTVIEEGGGRFFSSADNDICWTDVTRLEALDEARFAIDGELYCLAPLIEVNGASEVLIRDLEFRGLLDWNAS